MSDIAFRIYGQGERLESLTVEQLFERAEAFGKVSIFSSRDAAPPKCYRCKIVFDSIPGTSLEASSEFGRALAESLIEAIDRAGRIVEAYNKK